MSRNTLTSHLHRLGQLHQRLRELSGTTFLDLATRAKLSRSTVNKLERGEGGVMSKYLQLLELHGAHLTVHAGQLPWVLQGVEVEGKLVVLRLRREQELLEVHVRLTPQQRKTAEAMLSAVGGADLSAFGCGAEAPS